MSPPQLFVRKVNKLKGIDLFEYVSDFVKII